MKKNLESGIMTNNVKWFEYHYNILALARHLHETQGLNVEEILYLMEKPWKYSEEWKELMESEEE